METPIEKQAEVVAMDMASEVVSSPAPMDPLRELADRLMEAFRDQAAEWNSLAGEVMDHIRGIFEAAVRGHERPMAGDDAGDTSVGEADD